jgi:superoxide dismutase
LGETRLLNQLYFAHAPTIKDIVDDKIKTHVDAHVHPLIETVNKQQQTITEQAQTLSKQAAIITTLQTTAKDHTYTLSVVVFLVLGAFLGMMSVRSEIEFRRLICLFSCFSVAGRSSGLYKIKTHVDAHVHPLIETVNKQQQTITEQAQTLSKQAVIITTLQTTAKDHTCLLTVSINGCT